MYCEAEKYNLYLLGFDSVIFLIERKYLKRENYIIYLKTSIINKPDIKKRFLGYNGEQSVTFLCMYFI